MMGSLEEYSGLIMLAGGLLNKPGQGLEVVFQGKVRIRIMMGSKRLPMLNEMYWYETSHIAPVKWGL